MTGFTNEIHLTNQRAIISGFLGNMHLYHYVHLIFNQGKMESMLHPVNNENHFIAKISWLKQL